MRPQGWAFYLPIISMAVSLLKLDRIPFSQQFVTDSLSLASSKQINIRCRRILDTFGYPHMINMVNRKQHTPSPIEPCFFWYAVWKVAYAYASACAKFFWPHMGKPAACCSAHAILPTPKNQQVPTRRAYAAYAALQDTHDRPAQHVMQFPLSRFHDLKNKDAEAAEVHEIWFTTYIHIPFSEKHSLSQHPFPRLDTCVKARFDSSSLEGGAWYAARTMGKSWPCFQKSSKGNHGEMNLIIYNGCIGKRWDFMGNGI